MSCQNNNTEKNNLHNMSSFMNIQLQQIFAKRMHKYIYTL